MTELVRVGHKKGKLALTVTVAAHKKVASASCLGRTLELILLLGGVCVPVSQP